MKVLRRESPKDTVSDDLKQMTKQMTGPVDDSTFPIHRLYCVYS